MKKYQSLVMALTLAVAGSQVQAAAAPDYTETKTADGYLLVENKGGAELGLQADSGVKLLKVDGKVHRERHQNTDSARQ